VDKSALHHIEDIDAVAHVSSAAPSRSSTNPRACHQAGGAAPEPERDGVSSWTHAESPFKGLNLITTTIRSKTLVASLTKSIRRLDACWCNIAPVATGPNGLSRGKDELKVE
jgi:hypothetical protein